jgi:hypothetical protein
MTAPLRCRQATWWCRTAQSWDTACRLPKDLGCHSCNDCTQSHLLSVLQHLGYKITRFQSEVVMAMVQQQCKCGSVQRKSAAHLDTSCSEDCVSLMRRSHGSGGSSLACHTAPMAMKLHRCQFIFNDIFRKIDSILVFLFPALWHELNCSCKRAWYRVFASGQAQHTICIGHLLPSLRQCLTEVRTILQAHHNQPSHASRQYVSLERAGEQATCRLVRRSTAVKVPLPATLPNVMDTKPPAVGRYPWILAMMGPAGWHSTCARDIKCLGEHAHATNTI